MAEEINVPKEFEQDFALNRLERNDAENRARMRVQKNAAERNHVHMVNYLYTALAAELELGLQPSRVDTLREALKFIREAKVVIEAGYKQAAGASVNQELVSGFGDVEIADTLPIVVDDAPDTPIATPADSYELLTGTECTADLDWFPDCDGQ